MQESYGGHTGQPAVGQPPLPAMSLCVSVHSVSGNSPWFRSWRADPRALPLANRHYNRGNPNSRQFVPPGRCLVLLTRDADALWVTSWPMAEYVKDAWPGAWVNSLFRREATAPLASELIRAAVAATLAFFGAPPPLGWSRSSTVARSGQSRHPGRCYLRAGFRRVGRPPVAWSRCN